MTMLNADTAPARAPEASRWEYRTLDLVRRRDESEQLNRLGREGWEAVGLVSSWGVGWRFVHPIVLFKRPLPRDRAPSASRP